MTDPGTLKLVRALQIPQDGQLLRIIILGNYSGSGGRSREQCMLGWPSSKVTTPRHWGVHRHETLGKPQGTLIMAH